MTTRPVRFSGSQGFVNAGIQGELRVEVLDPGGKPIAGFTHAQSVPMAGDSTRLPMAWTSGASLASLAGQVVRFRFTLSRAHLFAFWVSASTGGQSGGYVAAGGPGFRGLTDTP